MKITVNVKTRSSKEGCDRNADGSWTVRVSVPPAEGKANIRVCELLAESLGVAKSSVRIVSGERSKFKIVEVP